MAPDETKAAQMPAKRAISADTRTGAKAISRGQAKTIKERESQSENKKNDDEKSVPIE